MANFTRFWWGAVFAASLWNGIVKPPGNSRAEQGRYKKLKNEAKAQVCSLSLCLTL